MSNVEKFISILEEKKWYFYHFTDSRNLPSIKEHGLLSMAELSLRNIETVTGGNEWSLNADKRKGMDVYVHLCFFREHPMEYTAKKEGRIESSRFLPIKPGILRTTGALISKGVSNKTNVSYGDPEQYIGEIDLDVIYNHTDWSNPAIKERLKVAKKCEILIPKYISLDFINNL